MELCQRTRRFGGFLIACALVLRLAEAGVPGKIISWWRASDMAACFSLLETGQNVRFSASEQVFVDHSRESPQPWSVSSGRPRVSEKELEGVEIYYACSLRPDLEAVLQPMEWNLMIPEPTVLILHTHATEGYTQSGETYVETSAYRTLDPDYNMVAVGKRVAEILTEGGISVLQDVQFHDYPSYNGAYGSARKSIREYLEEYPSVCLVLDLHRDASSDAEGQLRTAVLSGGKTMAQLMLVVGTNAAGQAHENWTENFSLALKLHMLLEQSCPGIMRPLCLRSQRFNQDLSPGALLVEVGAAGNTQGEALLAAERLADAIVAMAAGVDIE